MLIFIFFSLYQISFRTLRVRSIANPRSGCMTSRSFIFPHWLSTMLKGIKVLLSYCRESTLLNLQFEVSQFLSSLTADDRVSFQRYSHFWKFFIIWQKSYKFIPSKIDLKNASRGRLYFKLLLNDHYTTFKDPMTSIKWVCIWRFFHSLWGWPEKWFISAFIFRYRFFLLIIRKSKIYLIVWNIINLFFRIVRKRNEMSKCLKRWMVILNDKNLKTPPQTFLSKLS